jgi:enoyl-[acyl-carrier protein] reductase II
MGPTIVAEILAGGGQDYVPFAGQSVGLIHAIRPARDIVQDTVAEAEQILHGLIREPALRR